MAKYSLVMTPTPRRVAGCIISIWPTYSCAHALTVLAYLFTVGLGAYKTGNISKAVEDRAEVTINSYLKSYAARGLLIAAKMYDLE